MHQTEEIGLSSQRRGFEALLHLSNILGGKGNNRAMCQMVLEEVVGSQIAESATINIWDLEGQCLSLVAMAEDNLSRRQKSMSAPDVHPEADPNGRTRASYRGARTATIAQGIRSEVSLPIEAQDGRRLGVLTVVSKEDDTFDPQQVAPLSALTGGLALLVENAGLAQRLAASREELAGLEVKASAQSKLVSLGEAAAGAAQEINQPLTYISTMLQSIQEEVELVDLDPARLPACLSECRRQVERISSIVDHLRALGQSGEVEMREWT